MGDQESTRTIPEERLTMSTISLDEENYTYFDPRDDSMAVVAYAAIGIVCFLLGLIVGRAV